jgi:4-amino-4-deoxy-L-arabinose transferase-like glycosyltransferase
VNKFIIRPFSIFGGIVATVFLALALRLFYFFQFKKTAFFNNLSLDPLFYDSAAQKILTGDFGFGKEIFDMSPLYPYFLSIVYTIFGHHLSAPRLIHFLMGSLSCILLYLLGKRIFNKQVGLISALTVALYGPFIFTEGNLVAEPLVLFLNLLLLLSLIKSADQARITLWFMSGILLGLSAIIRPNVLLLLPLIIIWIGTLKTSFDTPILIKAIALFIFGTILAISPVTIRNYIKGGEFVLISSSGGMNFYIGNNPKATGTLTEPDFIRPNPEHEHSDARKEAIRRAGYQFMKNYATVLNLPLFHFGIIFPFAVLGLIVSTPLWRRCLPVYLIVVSYMAFLLLFFVTSRYRLPIVPFLILFSSFGIFQLWQYLSNKNFKKLGVSSLLIIIFAIFSNQDVGEAKLNFNAQSYMGLGNATFAENNTDDAISAYEKAYGLLPANPDIQNNLAWAYATKEINLEKAYELARNALKARARDTNMMDTLAFVHFRKGEMNEAKKVLYKALTLEPKNKKIKKRLSNLEEGLFLTP